jgi:uncharacterized protein YpmS
MATYSLVNGKILTELGDKSPIVKIIKAEIEDFKARKINYQFKIDELEIKKAEVQAEIDSRKNFLQSIGE